MATDITEELRTKVTEGHDGMPTLLTAQEVADYFRIKLETVYTWKCFGKLKATKIHGRLLFNINDILQMVG